MSVNHNKRTLIAIALLACLSCDSKSDNPDGAAPDANVDASVDGGVCASGDAPRTFYVDDDGDGFGRSGDGAIHGCHSDPPAGFSADARDCDDGDADKQRERFLDRDGDGYGTSDTARCVGSTETGYADRAGDCDDDDENRSPGATETWFDGSDLDCDGDEDPTGCIPAPGTDADSYIDETIALPPLSSIPVERDEGCAGPDLYIAVLGACRQCGGGTATVVIANRGTEASTFRVESELESLDVTEPLAPQGASDALVLELRSPSSTVRVTATGDGEDCDRTNDAREVVIGFTDCE